VAHRAVAWLFTLGLGLAACPCSAGEEYPELGELKKWARDVLALQANQFRQVDPRFDGVVEFGRRLQAAKIDETTDVASLTYTSRAYWRAALEVVPADQSILLAHANLLVARGEVAQAETYYMLASRMKGDEASRIVLDSYQKLRTALHDRTGRDIKEGIALHDKKKYDKALEAYDRALEGWPASAWAYYQKGFAYLMLSRNDPRYEPRAAAMYAECRARDPFYWRAYQGRDPEVIAKLLVVLQKIQPFISGQSTGVTDLISFAEGCEEIGQYPLAAHARWKLALLDPTHARDHIRRFLDLLDKAGCEDVAFFRAQFNLDPPPNRTDP
jgi:tetratricopeptide (TPR) repeat protein